MSLEAKRYSIFENQQACAKYFAKKYLWKHKLKYVPNLIPISIKTSLIK